MKIINNAHNRPYQLRADTSIEFEKQNLFFHNFGEQSIPLELPDSPENRRLTGQLHRPQVSAKPESKIPCTIMDGSKVIPAQQAILGANPGQSITTSLYINDGCFLRKIKDVHIKDVFKHRIVGAGFTVDDGVRLCRKIIDGSHPQLVIFPVLYHDGAVEGKYGDSYPKYKFLNEFGSLRPHAAPGNEIDHFPAPDSHPDFINAIEREEKENEDTYRLPRGLRIAPFLRAVHVLREIFKYFGYDLLPSLLDEHPFRSLALVHNCADILFSSHFAYEDMLPDCMVTTYLEVFRKKFNLEFRTNEVRHTAEVIFFRDIEKMPESITLDPFVVSNPSVSAPDEFRQIQLKSEETTEDEGSVPDPQSTAYLFNRYHELEIYPPTGQLFRRGVDVTSKSDYVNSVACQLVTNSSTKYYEGDSIPVHEVVVPDRAIDMRFSEERKSIADLFGLWQNDEIFPVIGSVKYLHTSLRRSHDVVDKMSRTEDEETKVMLCFAYNSRPGCCYGSVTNYAPGPNEHYIRMSDYSLCYLGPDGLFERFYKKLDSLYRNSLLSVQCSVSIPQHQVLSLDPLQPVRLGSAKMLLSTISYRLGRDSEQACTLLTTALRRPITLAKPINERIGHGIDDEPMYYWAPRMVSYYVTKQEFDVANSRFASRILYPSCHADADTVGVSTLAVDVPQVEINDDPHSESHGQVRYKITEYSLIVKQR